MIKLNVKVYEQHQDTQIHSLLHHYTQPRSFTNKRCRKIQEINLGKAYRGVFFHIKEKYLLQKTSNFKHMVLVFGKKKNIIVIISSQNTNKTGSFSVQQQTDRYLQQKSLGTQQNNAKIIIIKRI